MLTLPEKITPDIIQLQVLTLTGGVIRYQFIGGQFALFPMPWLIQSLKPMYGLDVPDENNLMASTCITHYCIQLAWHSLVVFSVFCIVILILCLFGAPLFWKPVPTSALSPDLDLVSKIAQGKERGAESSSAFLVFSSLSGVRVNASGVVKHLGGVTFYVWEEKNQNGQQVGQELDRNMEMLLLGPQETQA